MKKKNWQSAFKNTLPVMMGYLAMGAAAGIVLAGTLPQLPGTPLWAAFSSVLSVSGALQFLMVGWIKEGIALTDVVNGCEDFKFSAELIMVTFFCFFKLCKMFFKFRSSCKCSTVNTGKHCVIFIIFPTISN